jgi:hypothetical protein
MEQNRWRWRVMTVLVAILVAGCGRSGSAAPSSSATPSPKAYATPPARIYAAMAYDLRTHELVMYGGFTALSQAGGLNDTWAWDGKGWTQFHPQTVPAIQNPSMAYDAPNHELLLVGSEVNGQQRRNSLWAWKGGDWVHQFDWTSPDCGKSCPPSATLPFAAGALTYDSARGRMLMLTGGPAGPANETWTWDGAKWSKIPTPHGPTLTSCCVSPDGATGRLLALGYYFNWGGINRLWVFDGADWTLTSTSTPTGNVTMVDDPSTDRPLLVRSSDVDGNPSPGTWSWTGNAWQRLDVTPPPTLTGSSLGYDVADKEVILFGGRDAYGNAVSDSWVWNGRAWSKHP